MPNEIRKAQWVAQGHLDSDKPYIVHSTTTLRKCSTTIIVSVAAIKTFHLFWHDGTQAYIKSDGNLTRRVFWQPKDKYLEYVGISEKERLELLR